MIEMLFHGNLYMLENQRNDFPVSSGTSKESIVLVESIKDFSLLNISLDLNDPAVLKLLEQGGFVIFLLSLSLFFWILIQFVNAVKKE
jgi:hypothetical protein